MHATQSLFKNQKNNGKRNYQKDGVLKEQSINHAVFQRNSPDSSRGMEEIKSFIAVIL